MKLLRTPGTGERGRRGAALMLALLVLFVLILIVSQISYSAKTDARVARNEDALISMDMSIESVLLQAYEDLRSDAEADSAAGGGGGAGGLGGAVAGGGGGEEGAAAGAEAPSDSREDEWSRPQRTEMNDLQMRVLIQDEDSKFNLLSILTENEDEADKAFERLVRVIENARKGTDAEIVGGEARQLATAMLEFMNRRQDQFLPRPNLLTDDEDDLDIGLPLTLREFVALDPELFTADLFRDYRDENDEIVHSLGSFLTVWSSLGENGSAGGADAQAPGTPPPSQSGSQDEPDQGEEPSPDGGGQSGAQQPSAGGQGGAAGGGSGAAADGRINLNTAPPAVLSALLDARDVPYRFWDDVVEYRNEADEEVEQNDDPPLDEYGEEIVVKKFFSTLDDLGEIDGWNEIEPIYQGELKNLLKTQSSVFSIYVTARRPTGEERIDTDRRREDIEREEAEGQGLVRTVRSVVWRKVADDGSVEIVPIVRWEVLDYVPYEVQDYPDERR